MIQISFEIDALARAIMESVGEGSWEHWCAECPHPDHYYLECIHEGCKCTQDGGYDSTKSGPIPWEKLPDTGSTYKFGGRTTLNIKGKQYWREQADRLLEKL